MSVPLGGICGECGESRRNGVWIGGVFICRDCQLPFSQPTRCAGLFPSSPSGNERRFLLRSFTGVNDCGSVVAMQVEFPFQGIENTAPARSWLRDYADAAREHGAFVPQAMIAVTLGISRQAVNDFINRGRLGVVMIRGERYVPLTEALRFVGERRSNNSLTRVK